MDESVDPNDAGYPLTSLTSSTSIDRFNNPAAHGSLDLDAAFSFGSSFDTISPASLELFHTSHDDTCLDKCMGAYNPQGLHRGGYAPLMASRPRFTTSSLSIPFAYQMSDNSIFHPPPQFNHVAPDMFQEMGLRYGLNHGLKHSNGIPNYESQLGNHFSASDLGMMSQCPVPDDCTSIDCSRFSCSSQCCSTQVCQDESCSGDGTPCDDMHCFDGVPQPLEQMWNIDQDWNTPMPPDMIHPDQNAPCNHTNTEHDVAITLRDLSAPGASTTSTQQQQSGFPQFECPIFGADDSVHHDRALSLSLEAHSDLSHIPNIHAHPSSLEDTAQASIPTEHVCQWMIERGVPDTQDKMCGLVFNNPVELQQHVCDGHIASMSSKTKYVCLWKGCSRRGDQVFASRNKLRRHISTHTSYKPFTCSHCNQGFSAQQALDQHIRTHTGEKPYLCDVEGCDKSFKQKSALTMHKRTHTGEKPLTCEHCGKCFCESSNLSKHRKTHNPDFKYKCEEPGCDSQFIRIDQLRRHMARHSSKSTRQKKKQQRTRSLASITTSTDSSASPEASQYPVMLDTDHLNALA
ncbi:hypothetical protein F5X99DRAFT_381561 [Biscogniauxia marginata]|nr:hypothetical protein F5X99DRAFT_381561 [Biscogniauxia marginata]